MKMSRVLLAVVASMVVATHARADDVAVALTAIRAIAAEGLVDPEALLTRVGDVCRTAFQGREWTSVRDSLQAAGLKTLPDPDASNRSVYAYLLVENPLYY